MSVKSILQCLLLGLLGTSAAMGATIKVTHSPASGQYSTVTEALNNASAGDTIQIIDNSAAYNESVTVDKANITIEGLSTLDPRPTILGAGTGNNGPAGASTFGYTTNATGLKVNNLIVKVNAASENCALLSLDAAPNAVFTNCQFVSRDDGNASSRSFDGQVDVTFNQCDFLNGRDDVVYGQFAQAGTLTMHGCKVAGGIDGGISMQSGTLVVDEHSQIIGFTDSLVAWFSANVGDVNITFRDSIIKSTCLTDAAMVLVSPTATSYKVGLTIDNCDVIGSRTNSNTTGSYYGIRTKATMSSISIKDTIFSGIKTISSGAGSAISVLNSGLSGTIEDYNVFYDVPNTLASADGFTLGSHDVTLTNEPLYYDAANGDYHLLATSPAATASSTGGYDGSLGLLGARTLQVKHSPSATQYATVTAALAAAYAGDTIQVIDNSAPFNESINVDKANITIEGLSTLNPRPTILGTGTGVANAAGPSVFAYTANATGLKVNNLIVECNTAASTPDQVCLLSNTADGAVFTNCKFDAKLDGRVSGGPARAFDGDQDITFNQCTFLNGCNTLVYGQFTNAGTIVLHGCVVDGGVDGSICQQSGNMTIDQHSHVSSGATANSYYGICSTGNLVITVKDSLLSSKLTEALASLFVIDGNGTGGKATITIDNCDVIGGYNASTDKGTSTGIRGTAGASSSSNAITIKDTIFTGIKTRGVYMEGTGLSGTIEDYCVYRGVPNIQGTISGFTNGAHDVYLNVNDYPGNLLYVAPNADPFTGDYRLWQNSKAATCSSTGSFAGSLGLHPTKVPVELSTFSAE